MNKALLGIVAVLTGLFVIMALRAATVFDDVQLAPADRLAQVTLDEDSAVGRLAGATLDGATDEEAAK